MNNVFVSNVHVDGTIPLLPDSQASIHLQWLLARFASDLVVHVSPGDRFSCDKAQLIANLKLSSEILILCQGIFLMF